MTISWYDARGTMCIRGVNVKVQRATGLSTLWYEIIAPPL